MSQSLVQRKTRAAIIALACLPAGPLQGGDQPPAPAPAAETVPLPGAKAESASKETELLAGMGFAWEKPWLEGRDYLDVDPATALEAEDYLLLCREAQARAVTVSDADVQTLRAERGLTAERLAAVAQRAGVQPPACDAALRRWLAVQRLAPGGGGTITDDQVAQLIRDLMWTTHVRFSLLDSSLVLDTSQPPSEEERQSFFLRYKDVFPSNGTDGFGYRFAPRVAFEIVRTDLEADREKIAVTEEDTRAEWRELRKTELRTGQSMSKLPEDPTKEQEEAAYQRLLPDLDRVARRHKGGARAKQVMDWLRAAYRKRVAETGIEEPGLLEELADRAEEQSGLTIRYEAVPLTTAAFLARRRAFSAFTRFDSQGRAIALNHLLFRVSGHYQPLRPEQAELPCELGKMVDATLSTYDSGDAYDALVYRVVDFRPESPPARLDEVRESVERDLLLARAHETTRGHAERLCESAKKRGLADAWSAAPRVLRLFRGDSVPFEPVPFARAKRLPPPVQRVVGALVRPTELDRVGRDLSFLTAVFEHAEAMDRLENPSQADRVTMFPLPMKHQWVVLEWLENRWLSGDRAAVAKQMRRQWRQLGTIEKQRAWFNPQAIRDRAGQRQDAER